MDDGCVVVVVVLATILEVSPLLEVNEGEIFLFFLGDGFGANWTSAFLPPQWQYLSMQTAQEAADNYLPR